MSIIIENQSNELTPKRPAFLLVLCILSFISIGMSLITSLFSLVSGPSSEEVLVSAKVELTKQISQMNDLGVSWASDILRKMIHIMEATNASHYLYTFSTILIAVVGGIGVYMMFKCKKLGFHFYIIYSLLTAVQLYFFVDARYIPPFLVVSSILFSGVFIFLYALNLKHLK